MFPSLSQLLVIIAPLVSSDQCIKKHQLGINIGHTRHHVDMLRRRLQPGARFAGPSRLKTDESIDSVGAVDIAIATNPPDIVGDRPWPKVFHVVDVMVAKMKTMAEIV